MNTKVYLLIHTYEIEDIDEFKILGVFSSLDNVYQAIDIYRKQLGFKDYPIECFKIHEYDLNDYSKWKDAKTYIADNNEWEPGMY